jgi:hypothetical protein
VHVSEDRRNGADFVFARRFGSPGGRVKIFDKNLVHALIGGKDLDCGSAELSVNLGWTAGGQHYVGSITGLAFETLTETTGGAPLLALFEKACPER